MSSGQGFTEMARAACPERTRHGTEALDAGPFAPLPSRPARGVQEQGRTPFCQWTYWTCLS